MALTIDIQWIPVLVAAVVSFLAGWLWYSNVLFGKIWMKAMGITKVPKDKMKGMGMTMFAGLVSQVIMAIVLSFFIAATGEWTLVGALSVAFWAWLGFIATVGLGTVLWENKPAKLFWINSLHWLVALLIMAAVMSIWY